MRILGPIVPPQSLLVPSRQADFGLCRAVRAQPVGNQHIRREALFLEQLAHQFHGRSLVASSLHQQVENFAFVVNCTPQPELLARNHHGQVSGAGEFRPRALSEPDVILSHHPAPIVQPLLYGFALSTRILPSPVVLIPELNNATPSLQPHYRTFNTTTGCSAPVPRLGTLTLIGTAYLGFSLSIGATGSRVPHRSLDQSHAAFMPDAAWAEIRPSPRLVPG